jgi:AraC-like DNA-binding protein
VIVSHTMTDPIFPQQHFTDLQQLPIRFSLGGFNVTMFGWGFIDAVWWRNYLHEHSYFEVCYVWKGNGLFRVNRSDYTVQQGHVFVAKPHEPHEIISSEDDPMGVYFWSYTLVPEEPTQNDTDLLLRAFLTSDERVKAIANLQHTLNRLTLEIDTRQPGYLYLIQSLSSQLVLEIARAFTPTATLPGRNLLEEHDSTSALVANMVRYIQDNYARPLTVRDVAAQIHLSKRHTDRLFQRAMGISIHQYLTQYRLKIAAQLLLNKKLSVAETAYACGYRDPRYFITLFKRYNKMTPAVFQKQGGTRFL